MTILKQFGEHNGWRIESVDHPYYVVRVCRNKADCNANVWGYYTQDEMKRNVHLEARARAAKGQN